MISQIELPDHHGVSFRSDPYRYWARLRADCPVQQVEAGPRRSVWLVTRYDDVVTVLQSEQFVKDRLNVPGADPTDLPWTLPAFRPLNRTLLDLDPPDHTRLRALLHRGFVPRVISRLRERIVAICGALLDRVQGHGGLDLVAEYATPLPSMLSAEMLGVPLDQFERWSALYTSRSTADPIGLLRERWAFMQYLRGLIEERRSEPREDLISALVQSQAAGAEMSDDELVSMVVLLFEGSHVTTINLIGSGMLVLLEHPDQLAQLRVVPASIETAVEELLRYVNPLDLATPRFVRDDVEIAGLTLPRGAEVLAVLASANRDERVFADPDLLDIHRQPNEHLAFGWGRHYCLGAALARLEVGIAITMLLERLPNLRLAVPRESIRRREDVVLEGLESLPLAF